MISLDSMIASLKKLGARDVEKKIAAAAAPILDKAIRSQLNAGKSPAGKSWAPKKGGGQAYQHAASKIETAALGNLVRVTLSGPEVYGHFGTGHLPARQMIPDAGAAIPSEVEEALDKAAAQVFAEAVK